MDHASSVPDALVKHVDLFDYALDVLFSTYFPNFIYISIHCSSFKGSYLSKKLLYIDIHDKNYYHFFVYSAF
jgi:hypothetical protein